MSSKMYRGYRDGGDPLSPAIVVVHDERGTHLLKHETGNSPTGFSWGHSGGGSATLAHSILADYLGRVPNTNLCEAFKWAFIAQLEPGRGWMITGEQIAAWLTDTGLWQDADDDVPF